MSDAPRPALTRLLGSVLELAEAWTSKPDTPTPATAKRINALLDEVVKAAAAFSKLDEEVSRRSRHKGPPRLTADSLTLLHYGWRTHRTLDVYSHIEESLTLQQAPVVQAFIAWLQAHPEQKTGWDHLPATLAAFYASQATP